MYETFYKLQGKPFSLSPDFRFYFESQGHKRHWPICATDSSSEGFIVIRGIGTGKSTLVEMLFNMINRQNMVAAKLVTTRSTPTICCAWSAHHSGYLTNS